MNVVDWHYPAARSGSRNEKQSKVRTLNAHTQSSSTEHHPLFLRYQDNNNTGDRNKAHDDNSTLHYFVTNRPNNHIKEKQNKSW